MSASSIDEISRKIVETQAMLHGAGTVSARTLAALVRHTSTRAIRHSAETGCGATTLLISHLSQDHTVFALDVGASVSNARRSPLLRGQVVTFVEGPSQIMLQQHRFREKLQLVLLDGPHAYPFPDLEYYFLYPHLEAGALFILDDLQIPTINNLFRFLRRDRMFQLDEVVRNTAFFTGTDAQAVDPLGDGWRGQAYNEHTLLRCGWRSRLSGALSHPLLRYLLSVRRRAGSGNSRYSVEILTPRKAESVGDRR